MSDDKRPDIPYSVIAGSDFPWPDDTLLEWLRTEALRDEWDAWPRPLAPRSVVSREAMRAFLESKKSPLPPGDSEPEGRGNYDGPKVPGSYHTQPGE